MNIPKNGINAQNVSFSGHNRNLDKSGFEVHKFYYMYDPKRYNCDLEVFNIAQDSNKNIVLQNKVAEYPLKGVPYIEKDMSEIEGLNSELGFAYRFKLTELDANGYPQADKVSYAFDNGQVIGIFDDNSGKQYNVVLNNRAVINKNGPMQLIMPDEYYPGIEKSSIDGSLNIAASLRNNVRQAVRTHANKLGGQFIGITKRLRDGAFRDEGIRRIVGTPFTKDTVSSHLYWTENAYQVSPGLGTEKDFKELQVELFKNGINWIADAALVNEGFGGIHMSELLRNGQNSVSKNMFRTQGDKVLLGILPNDAAGKGFTRMKIINAPFTLSADGKSYKSSNKAYRPDKPTYIQLYDDRLVSEEQRNSQSPSRLTTYDKKNVDDNIYAITEHDDAVYPFPIEVDPAQLARNVQNVYKSNGSVDLADVNVIKQVADFPTFQVVTKPSAGNLEFWDGNVDIAKLNFFRSVKDDTRFYNPSLDPAERQKAIKDFDLGTYAVREYAVNSGKYWTQLTADTQLEYVSGFLSGKGASSAEDYLKIINAGVKNSDMPEMAVDSSIIDEEVIQNVLDGNYNLRRLNQADMRSEINPESPYGNTYSLSDYILKKAMDVPLETLPVAVNLLGIITSPYIAKRPNTTEEIGISRYDTYKAGNPNLPDKYSYVYKQTEKFYADELVPVIKDIFSEIDGIQNEDGTVSEYGKYVISETLPDILRYILVRSLRPGVKLIPDKQGVFDFSQVPSEDITMQSLGIPYKSKDNNLENEAQIVLRTLNKGIKNLKKDGSINTLKQSLKTRVGGRTLDDYKVAEMILDRTESGLGWRIDAAKDVASIDAVREGYDSMISAWDNVIDVWKLFNQSVLNINPHAYTTAELTDLDQLFSYNSDAKYIKEGDAERKFLQETGITSVANYNYFFSMLPQLFSLYNFETGMPNWSAINGQNNELTEKLDTGWTYGDLPNNPGFLFQSPEEGVINSYTFVGNHDKPRMLHCLALDMNLFHFGYLSDDAEAALRRQLQTESDGGIKYNIEQRLKCDPINKKKTAEFFGKDVDEINDFTKFSSEAVAMGIRIKEAIDASVSDENTKKALDDAVVSLAQGEYKDKSFNAHAFGTRSFEHAIKTVLDEAEYKNGKIEGREKIESDILENMLAPAFDKFLSIYKTLMILPGSPTDFAGDRVGLTGYESKAKNYHQQNRNVINWEWLDKKDSSGADNDLYRPYIADFYNSMNEIANLRSNPKLAALNNGDTITLPMYQFEDNGKVKLNSDGKPEFNPNVQALLRYNDEGNIVLAFFDSTGSSAKNNEKMKRGKVISNNNKLYLLNDMSVKRGLKHGISEGTVFKNPVGSDNAVYTVKKDANGYYLEKSINGEVQPITISDYDLNSLILYKEV